MFLDRIGVYLKVIVPQTILCIQKNDGVFGIEEYDGPNSAVIAYFCHFFICAMLQLLQIHFP